MTHHNDRPEEYERHKGTMFEMFGGLLPPAVSMLLVGWNLHVFADKGINYILIFELDRNSMTTAVRESDIDDSPTSGGGGLNSRGH